MAHTFGKMFGCMMKLWLKDTHCFLVYHKKKKKKKATVKEAWETDSGNWNLGFRRNLKDVEISERATLLHQLSNIQLSSSPDKRVWILEKNGIFSTRSLLQDISPKGDFAFPPLVWCNMERSLPQRKLNFSFGS